MNYFLTTKHEKNKTVGGMLQYKDLQQYIRYFPHNTVDTFAESRVV